MDNDAVDWMPWFDMDTYLATSPQNDVQGHMFAYKQSSGLTEECKADRCANSMLRLDGDPDTLDPQRTSPQPQGLVRYATQPFIGEANFPSHVGSESLATFFDSTFLQDFDNNHGTIVQDPGARALTGSSSPALDIDQYRSCAALPGCSCMACLLIGVPGDWKAGLCCHFKGCNFTTDIHAEYISHERDHYHEAGDPLFHCVEQHCKFATKRWPDLIRHYTVRHCTKPKQFSCPVPWCKYSGDNGFARKDKLRSHQRNVHQGLVTSVTSSTLRPIQPAMSGSRAFAN